MCICQLDGVVFIQDKQLLSIMGNTETRLLSADKAGAASVHQSAAAINTPTMTIVLRKTRTSHVFVASVRA